MYSDIIVECIATSWYSDIMVEFVERLIIDDKGVSRLKVAIVNRRFSDFIRKTLERIIVSGEGKDGDITSLSSF